jgi:pimeloyl-ACP methyl ester carboxylesterase
VASNANVSLVELPGLTHFPAMEDPEGVARLCVDFLGGAA